eukprot:3083948-Prymnesium_polylepis.1
MASGTLRGLSYPKTWQKSIYLLHSGLVLSHLKRCMVSSVALWQTCCKPVVNGERTEAFSRFHRNGDAAHESA